MRLVLIVFICSVLCFGCQSDRDQKKPPSVDKGVIDLRGWDFDKNGAVSLRGEWEFYWNEFLFSSDFNQSDTPTPTKSYFQIPGFWTDLDMPAFGYATFRIILRVDDDRQYALKFQDVYAAYTVFVNGKELGGKGKTGTTAENSTDQITPQIIDIPESSRSDQLEIIIQISNHSMFYSGFPQDILFGDKLGVHRLREMKIAIDLFLIGAILIMSIYHFGLYFLRRKDRSSLYFALFCLATVAYTSLIGESSLYFLFPNVKVFGLYRILLVSLASVVTFFSFFFRSVFPHEYSPIALRLNQLYWVIVVLAVIFAPPPTFLHLYVPVQVFSVIMILYTIFAFILSIIRKRIGAISMLIGFSIWIALAINDILYYHLIIDSVNLMPFGLCVFIFSQSFLLSVRFNNAFTMAEELSSKLNIKNIELEKAERKYRSIFEKAVEGIFQADKDGNVVNINPTMARIFGYSTPDEMLMTEPQLVNLIQSDLNKENVKRLETTPDGKLDFDDWFVTKTGDLFWGSIFMKTMDKQKTENVFIEGMILDLSEKKLREAAEIEKEKAEQENRIKDEFITYITHELRAPLQAVIGYSRLGLGRKTAMKAEKVQGYFQRIYESGNRQLMLVNDLLDLFKYEQGRMEFTFQRTSIFTILRHTTEELGPLVQEKNIELDLREPADDDFVEIDVAKFTQVFINLFSNAVKFTPQNGRIAATFDITNEDVRFSLLDNGMGIPEDELEKIFEKFTQSKKNKKSKEGTGLGLAITRQIIEGHRGRIWAESNPDGGSIFIFVIPKTQPIKMSNIDIN